MTPQERAFAAERLRELVVQTDSQVEALQPLRDERGERNLLLGLAGSVAVLAEVLADVIEDRAPEPSAEVPEASGR